MDGGTTDAASECGGLEPAARMEGRGWGHAAGQCISVVDLDLVQGSGRGMGSLTMHAKMWKWWQTPAAGIFILISQRCQVSADSVMW